MYEAISPAAGTGSTTGTPSSSSSRGRTPMDVSPVQARSRVHDLRLLTTRQPKAATTSAAIRTARARASRTGRSAARAAVRRISSV